MKTTSYLLTVLIIAKLLMSISLASGKYLNESIIAQRIEFESPSDIASWQLKSGSLSLSTKHYKQGKKSLKWDIEGTLTLNQEAIPGLQKACSLWPGGQPETLEPTYVKPSHQGGIKIWLYRETPKANGFLTFKVGNDEATAKKNPKYQFRIGQNFTGWRTVWVNFNEDAKVDHYTGPEQMRCMVIEPSKNLKGDKVYIDMLQFLTFISHKRHSDEQFTNSKDPSYQDSYLIFNYWKNLKKFKQQESSVSAEETTAFSTIENRLENLMLGRGKQSLTRERLEKSLARNLSSAISNYQQLKLERNGQGITGIPMFSSRDEQPAQHFKTFQSCGTSVFYPLALDYRRNPTQNKLKRLIDLFDHFKDQGFTYGSALGTTDHIIRLNFYSASAFLLRKELKQQNRLREKQLTLDWHTRMGKLTGWDKSKGENSDLIRGGALPKLVAILLMPEGTEKSVRMRAYMDYLRWTMADAPGYMDTIKPDYSVFHHLGAYQNSYGVEALTTLAIIDWLTYGTPFAHPETVRKKLKDTLLGQLDFAADFELHPGVCGRFPQQNDAVSRILLPAYALMAEHKGTIRDQQMADLFARVYAKADTTKLIKYFSPGLTFFGSYGTVALMDRIAEYPTKNKVRIGRNGFFSFPYAGYATQKRDSFTAAVRGTSKYIWDFESSGKDENPYGRFAGIGALLLFTGENSNKLLSLDSSDMPWDQFHMSYIPGATTKELPMEKVFYHVAAHPKYKEGKHRNFTEQTFLGALDAGDNGVFAMDFVDTVPTDRGEAIFEPGFSAKKSWFFFDNQIICLGSNISNKDKKHSTITTLFQNIPDPRSNNWATYNGKRLDTNDSLQGGLLKDTQGNFYHVPNRYTVRLSKESQLVQKIAARPNTNVPGSQSTFENLKVAAQKGWIDHGKAPENQTYVYSILVKGDPEQAKQMSSSFKVLQQNQQAHVVRHHATGITSQVLFKATSQPHLPIVAIDTPLIISHSETKDKLSLFVTDPDLRLAKWNHNMSHMPDNLKTTPALPHQAKLTIKGKWKIDKASAMTTSTFSDNTTNLTITLRHGSTEAINLKRVAK